MTKLVIVESSGKIKKIEAALPKDFVVSSSNGHIRDLPDNASELPEVYRQESWAKLGVDVDNDFKAYYVAKGSSKTIKELKDQLRSATELYLATDGDREGEAISWHLLETLKPKVPTHRMVFREITKDAIQKALKNTREVDSNLVEAQEARRILDRLIGYPLSILLGQKIVYGLSAGRVQCPVIRLVVDRERERRAFRSGSYWDLKAHLKAPTGAFQADLISIDGKKLATGADFDKDTGKIAEGKDVLLLAEPEANALVKSLIGKAFTLKRISTRPIQAKPYPPFMTSSLQIEASRKLNMDAKTTMSIAQALYESGRITYMRTDSVSLSEEAIQAARSEVEKMYGKEYLSPQPMRYTTKSKAGVQAQEAHEAIRPAGSSFVLPESSGLRGAQLKLYDLIWKRTMACQMANAKKRVTTYDLEVEVDGKSLVFRTSGTTIDFAGFLRAYVEGSDDPSAALEDQDSTLPAAQEEQEIPCNKVTPHGHETQPPPRYTQSSLQKKLEDEGIGRPSTYATFYQKITDGRYGWSQGRSIVPTFTAFAVADFFAEYFPEVMELSFTADMEAELDQIAEGGVSKATYLRQFYSVEGGFSDLLKKGEQEIEGDAIKVVEFDDIEDFVVRIGPYGPYAQMKADESRKVDIPKEIAPADLTNAQLHELLAAREAGPTVIGQDPVSGAKITLKVGRFGPYLQLGEADKETKTKPITSSLPQGLSPEDITEEAALFLLSLPKQLGSHPDDGQPVDIALGRYGAFVRHNKESRSLANDTDLFTITLDAALKLLAEPKQRKGRAAAKSLRDLGEVEGEPISILDGRFGPYVKLGKVNASLPKGSSVDSITLEEAIMLIEERKVRMEEKKKKTPSKTTKTSKTTKATKSTKTSSATKSTKAKSTKTTAAKTTKAK